MIEVVNYSEYINYCEISIICVTSKSSKLNDRNCVHFSTTIFCLKFDCADDAGTEKNCEEMGIGRRTRPAETEWGWRQGLRGCGGMGTVLWERYADWDEQLSTSSRLVEKLC